MLLPYWIQFYLVLLLVVGLVLIFYLSHIWIHMYSWPYWSNGCPKCWRNLFVLLTIWEQWMSQLKKDSMCVTDHMGAVMSHLVKESVCVTVHMGAVTVPTEKGSLVSTAHVIPRWLNWVSRADISPCTHYFQHNHRHPKFPTEFS